MARFTPRGCRLHPFTGALPVLRLLQSARRVCALSGNACEVVDTRISKTLNHQEREERRSSLLVFFKLGNTIESSEWEEAKGSSFVAFNWETKHTQQYAVQLWQARVRPS